jgi:hypothetical protein
MELLNNQAYEKLNDDIKALIRQTQVELIDKNEYVMIRKRRIL